MKKITISKCLDDSKQAGISLQRCIETDMDKAVDQIIRIVKSGHKGKIDLLARTLNCHLAKHTDLFSDLNEKIREKDTFVLRDLGDYGLRKAFI